jgi:hypothetical protein
MTAVGNTKPAGKSSSSFDKDGIGSVQDRGTVVAAARKVKATEGSTKAARVARALMAQVPLEALTIVARKAIIKA